jgi:hypothetical protein
MLLAPRLERAGLTAQRALDAIASQVDADIRELLDEHGNIKPLHTSRKRRRR